MGNSFHNNTSSLCLLNKSFGVHFFQHTSDDEEALTDWGQNMLQRHGYQVTVCNDSLEALKIFKNQPDFFDIVITDQTMPLLTGADLASQMLIIKPDIPIILCTGYSSFISEQKALALRIKAFVYKPIRQHQIVNMVRKILDETKDV